MNKEIHEYTVDLSGVNDREALHRRLEQALQLPAWYGRNLDALYDVLTDAPLPLHVRFTDWEELQEGDPVYFNRFRSVLSDAAKDLPGSSFVFDDEYEEYEEAEEAFFPT